MSNAKKHVILDAVQNSACRNCANRDERKQYQDGPLCGDVVSELDGLPVRCVGKWSFDKIYRLVQYFGIFAQGMHKIWKGGINYIEICSGPGRCVTREDGEEINGTSMAILKDRRFGFVNQALFIDKDERIVETLNKRIENCELCHKAKAVTGDYTDSRGVLKELETLSQNSLNLVFIDPTECNVPFETIKAIAGYLKNVDFIINATIGTDVNRNLASTILDPAFRKTLEKYGSFLGETGFFQREDVIRAAKNSQSRELKQKFAEEYKKQLQQLGYMHINIQPVRHYYYLVFASKHPKGLDFWNKACKYTPDGQKTFF